MMGMKQQGLDDDLCSLWGCHGAASLWFAEAVLFHTLPEELPQQKEWSGRTPGCDDAWVGAGANA
jgi:hypothetical protein